MYGAYSSFIVEQSEFPEIEFVWRRKESRDPKVLKVLWNECGSLMRYYLPVVACWQSRKSGRLA
jgi:hypothetical protein